MRHKKNFNHLGRQRGHRKAMLSNMASSLIVHKRIKTTTAKAKALKIFVEPLITKAKEDTTHSRRHVFSNLQDKEATNELFREVVAKVGERPGGYTRIIKLGKWLGDNADMCIIELVDFNENMLADKAAAKTSRRRRGAKKKTDETEVAVEEKAVEVVEEASAFEVVEEKAAEIETTAEEVVADEVIEEAAVVEEVVEEAVVAEAPEIEEVKEEKKEEEDPEATDEPASDESTADKEGKKEE